RGREDARTRGREDARTRGREDARTRDARTRGEDARTRDARTRGEDVKPHTSSQDEWSKATLTIPNGLGMKINEDGAA
ncbi:hypothetical protein CJ255_02280, partial [Candidatus Viridilinea mediisalina]